MVIIEGARSLVSKVEREILRKMLYSHYVGGKHTSADNIPKGLPRHMHGEVKKALKNLIREGYVMPKVTGYGVEVSLNPRRMTEICGLVEEP